MPRKRKVVIINQENEKPLETIVEKPTKTTQAEKPAKKQKREPDFMIGDGLNVIKTILSVQKTECNSQKALIELKKLYERMSHSDFMKSFMAALQVFLIRDDGDEYASRGLKFMGVFIAEYGEVHTESGASHPIIDTFFKQILEITSPEVHVRTRICFFFRDFKSLEFVRNCEIFIQQCLDLFTKNHWMIYIEKEMIKSVKTKIKPQIGTKNNQNLMFDKNS
ncbi:hypothetical protein PVAND_004882 [Polypedilum vanderplanki]|uniref:Uncharacterized protein n=1 Tax=Polypedilum vanderplanki TaxID=319348 RepID=A0A9J6BYW2_POLVA|nr:hypothetical protein PVAND_004882 [Polypedilum vanderplanki]